MEYQILRPVDHRPRSDVAVKDLQETYWRSEIVPPSEEVAQYAALQQAHHEALQEDQARHETYTGRRAVGMMGEFALRIHPEVTTLQQAAEVQRTYETGTESTSRFMANIAMESIVSRWEASRTRRTLGAVASWMTRTRQALAPSHIATAGQERFVGVAPMSRFSSEDLAFLASFRNGGEFGGTRVA